MAVLSLPYVPVNQDFAACATKMYFCHDVPIFLKVSVTLRNVIGFTIGKLAIYTNTSTVDR